MSASSDRTPPEGQPAPLANWQALSGDAPPSFQPPRFDPPPPRFDPPPQEPLPPVQGGWQQAWQDEQGQWHAPWAAHQPQVAPPYADPAPVVEPEPAPVTPTFVAPAELAPVGPPRYAAPARAARDPRHATLAAVLAFVSLLVALWAILGFIGSLSSTLSSLTAGNDKLKVQLTSANKSLLDLLEGKTSNLDAIATDSRRLKVLLGGIDTDMGTMLAGVDRIGTGMKSMDGSLATLDGEISTVNDLNGGMAKQLAGINSGLKSQVGSVRTMRKDVIATSGVLGTLSGRLAATNGRLAFVNNAVNTMGCKGITNNLEVKISLGPIPNGSAKVYATVVPPGAWGTLADGVTPC